MVLMHCFEQACELFLREVILRKSDVDPEFLSKMGLVDIFFKIDP